MDYNNNDLEKDINLLIKEVHFIYTYVTIKLSIIAGILVLGLFAWISQWFS